MFSNIRECETLWTPEHMYEHVQYTMISNGVVKHVTTPPIVPHSLMKYSRWLYLYDDKIHIHIAWGYPLASYCHNYRFNLESLMSFVVSLLPFELKACNLNFVALQVEYIMRYECRATG